VFDAGTNTAAARIRSVPSYAQGDDRPRETASVSAPIAVCGGRPLYRLLWPSRTLDASSVDGVVLVNWRLAPKHEPAYPPVAKLLTAMPVS